MTREDFYIEIGNIDISYIEEADKKPSKINRRFMAIAAAVLLMAVTAIGTSESVRAEIKKLFKFIPGITIEESTKPNSLKSGMLYSMDGDPVTQTDGNITVTLQNAYVDSYNIDVVYKIRLDLLEELYADKKMVTADEINKILKEKGIDYIQAEDGEFFGPNITVTDTISVDGVEYTPDHNGGGSIIERQYSAGVDYFPDEIKKYGKDLPLALTVGDLSFDIKLKEIESYDSIDQIGPTDVHNDISLTVGTYWDGEILNIKFYPLNYSRFKGVAGYKKLTSEKTIKPYLVIGEKEIPAQNTSGDGTEFFFDLSEYSFSDEQKKNAILHVPCIEVYSEEEAVLNFEVNPDGTIDYPEKLSLEYVDLHITSMTVGTEDWEDSIGLNFTVENKTNNIELAGIHLDGINGRLTGGTGSWTMSDENVWETAFSSDSIDVNDYHSVRIERPTYYILDEYVFSLN